MKKKLRQEKLLEVISRYEVETQDELIERLDEYGIKVTQATVSRDIRELKIAKMTTGKGRYRYILPRQTDRTNGMRFSAALTDSIISVKNASNLVVVKTYPGLANAVAVGIDQMNLTQILGCVAGDDTILIVMQDDEVAVALVDRVRELLKNI